MFTRGLFFAILSLYLIDINAAITAITISQKTLIISTKCRGIPLDPNQDLATCDEIQLLTKRVKNNAKLNRQNICNQLQSTYKALLTGCISYCYPCKYRYTG